MAYEELPKSLLAERKTLTFRNTEPPLLRNHHAFCQEMAFNRNHTGVPTVIIAASHQTGLGKLEPNYNSIAAWVEVSVGSIYNHTRVPTVIIVASHQTGLGKLEPNYTSIVAWVEVSVG